MRLIDDFELLAGERLAKLMLDHPPPLERLVHAWLEAAHAQIQFLFSDANADMWTAGFVSIRMTNLDDVRLRTA